MKIYAITLQTGKRKTETMGYFSSEEVANGVAATMAGYEDGEGVAATGQVVTIDVNDAATMDDYQASQAVEQELAEREQWAAFYATLTDEQKILMAKHAPTAQSTQATV